MSTKPSANPLFISRGMDEASLWAFVMAGSVSDTTMILSGGTGMIMGDVTAMVGSFDRDQRLYDELPWLVKHGHAILDVVSMVAGTAAMIIPGVGWAVGGMLAVAGAAGVANIVWYASEGDVADAVLTGVLLIPIMIGGVVRLVRIATAQLGILRTGGTIKIAGRTYRLDNTRLVLVDGPGSKPPITQTQYNTYVAGLDTRAANYGSPQARLYQHRVAGLTEYELPCSNGDTIWADGLRYDPDSGGVVVEAKFVDKPGSSLYEGTGGNADFLWKDFYDEVRRYALVVNDPDSPVTLVEIVTSTPQAQANLARRIMLFQQETGIDFPYIVIYHP